MYESCIWLRVYIVCCIYVSCTSFLTYNAYTYVSIGLSATMMHEAVYYESLVKHPTTSTALTPVNGIATTITEIPSTVTNTAVVEDKPTVTPAAVTTAEAGTEEKKSNIEPVVDALANGSSGVPHEEGEDLTDLIPPSTRALDSPVGSGRGKAESLVVDDTPTPTLTLPTEPVEPASASEQDATNTSAPVEEQEGEVNEVGPRTPANSPSLKQAALGLASTSTPTAPTTAPAPPTTTTTAPPLDYNKLSLELKQMAFTTAQGIHDAGWVDFGYQFATPEVSVYT